MDSLFEKLILLVKNNSIKCDLDRLKSAFIFAYNAHEWQFRDSGEPYITHPFEVASILTNYWVDETTLVSALLHDCVEDCSVSLQDIKNEFWQEVENIVDWLTKVDEIVFENYNFTSLDNDIKSKDIETIRKILEKSKDDIRIILIKMIDRLHNMRTLSWKKSEESKTKKAKETINIFVKIADKLWLVQIKNELFDISYSYLKPENYNKIKRFINNTRDDKEKILWNISKKIKEKEALLLSV